MTWNVFLVFFTLIVATFQIGITTTLQVKQQCPTCQPCAMIDCAPVQICEKTLCPVIDCKQIQCPVIECPQKICPRIECPKRICLTEQQTCGQTACPPCGVKGKRILAPSDVKPPVAQIVSPCPECAACPIQKCPPQNTACPKPSCPQVMCAQIACPKQFCPLQAPCPQTDCFQIPCPLYKCLKGPITKCPVCAV